MKIWKCYMSTSFKSGHCRNFLEEYALRDSNWWPLLATSAFTWTGESEVWKLNFFTACYKKISSGQDTVFLRIIEELLRQKGRPNLATHIESLGPTEWVKTADRVAPKNRMLEMAFRSMADYLSNSSLILISAVGLTRAYPRRSWQCWPHTPCSGTN